MKIWVVCRHTKREPILAPCNVFNDGFCGRDTKKCDARMVRKEE